MNKFRNWYIHNQDAITWFVIGILTSALIDHLIKAQYGWAMLDAVFIWANYKMAGIRLA